VLAEDFGGRWSVLSALSPAADLFDAGEALKGVNVLGQAVTLLFEITLRF